MMQLSGGVLVILTEEATNIMKKLKRFLMVLSLAAVGCMSGDGQALAQENITGTERVTMSETNLSVFPRGEKNDAYAQYFVGQSYLQMLSTERVVIGNVTFEPGCRNNWHIHHKAARYCWSPAGVATISSGASRHASCIPATWSISRLK